jgi:hypothetical protein
VTAVRRAFAAAIVLGCTGTLVPALSPQTPPAQAPPARPDTTKPRAPQDTIPGWPYLDRAIVPMPPAEVPPGPLPRGARYRFTRDSITWSAAQTLSDLLTAIPGVYVARTGFLGLPEYTVYAGRGAAELEVYWDGLPLLPLGQDSIYLDPARVPLTYLREVDVEVLPATLRVYLVSARHETLFPRSLVRIMSGTFHTASYAGLFEQRWPTGVGLDLAGNFQGTDGGSGPSRSDQEFDAWGKVEWLPTASTGAAYQFRRQQYDRSAVKQGKGGIPVTERLPARHGARTDALFTLFASTRPFGMGLGATGGLGTSTWSNDSTIGDRSIHQAFLTAGYRGSRWSVEGTGRLADARTTAALEGRLAWAPFPGTALSGDGALRRHPGGRQSRAAHGSAGLQAGPFSLMAELAYQDGVQAPALGTDTAQRTVDRAVRFGLDTRPLSGHLGVVRRDGYRPLPFPELAVIPTLTATRPATYLVANARLQPISPLSLDGWYATPRTAGSVAAADFQPPAHARAQLTFRSKFWRTFRSGAFDLKLQIALETWSDGTAGLDAGGQPIRLPKTTYLEEFVSFQIVGFTMFWDLRDARNQRKQYVPGLDYPGYAQVFGVKWEFKN